MRRRSRRPAIIPIAFGANAQQLDWLFEAILAGAGGKDLYRKVFVDHDAKAAGSDGMQHVFDVMGQIRPVRRRRQPQPQVE